MKNVKSIQFNVYKNVYFAEIMRLLSKIVRCSKITNFYRKFVSDVKSTEAIAINIIGCGSPGESASVSLSIANQDKYLFNCGEDCRRLFIDQNRKIFEIKHIFVTQTKWSCIGGISFICNFINKQGWLPMFHGPKQLYKCIKRILCLSILSELDFRPIDCNLKNFFEDDNLHIDFISIKINTTIEQDLYRPRDDHEVLLFIGEVKSQNKNSYIKPNERCDVPARFMSSFFFDYVFINFY